MANEEDKQLISWISENITESQHGHIPLADLKTSYEKHSGENISTVIYGKSIKWMFPCAKAFTPKDKTTGIPRKAYRGIAFNSRPKTDLDINGIENVYSLNEITNKLPKSAMLLHSSISSEVTFAYPSNVLANGNLVLKTVILKDHSWALNIRGKEVDLHRLSISERFECTKRSLDQLIILLEKIRLCTGVPFTETEHLTYDIDNRFLVKETVSKRGDENSTEQCFRAHSCYQILTWGACGSACRACQHSIKRNDIAISEPSEFIELNKDDSEDLKTILDKVFSNATEEMKVLLQSQKKALGCKLSTSMRWDKRVISLCLSLWVRSPQTYQDLKDSNMLILPSGRQLRRYKNKVHQGPGVTNEVCRWMYQAAMEGNLEEHGYAGGLLHDETKIQSDLVVELSDGVPILSGWVDTGDEGGYLRILKEDQVRQTLASSVLQVTFLGYSGFRFPVCHYPCTNIKASELHVILWEAVAQLQDWCFTIDFIMSDGGEENRQFTKMHFTTSPVDSSYLSANLVNPLRKLAHAQDFSHNMKKIRNGVLSSGRTTGFHKKLLQRSDHVIIWEHLEAAVSWDRCVNSRPISYQITDAHLHPNPAEKMRNHLAEDMLGVDMLYLLESFRASLPCGEYLDGTISLLRQTSKMIEIFRDKRSITSMSDERLTNLHNIFVWFREWKDEVLTLDIPKGKKSRMMLSRECLEDIDSMLLSFKSVCQMHLNEFPGSYIIPSRFNSDLIENHFCQQRGLHNGNSTHPSYHTYCSTVNAIILGQSLKSRGRKSNAGLVAASPYNMYVDEPVCKKKKRYMKDRDAAIKVLSNMR